MPSPTACASATRAASSAANAAVLQLLGVADCRRRCARPGRTGAALSPAAQHADGPAARRASSCRSRRPSRASTRGARDLGQPGPTTAGTCGSAAWRRRSVSTGRVVGAVAVLSDLSERLRLHEQGRDLTRMQSALQERNAELRAVTDSVRDYAIFTVNPEGRIASWHQGAALLKGYSAEEAIGMPFAQLFTPEDRQAGRPQHGAGPGRRAPASTRATALRAAPGRQHLRGGRRADRAARRERRTAGLPQAHPGHHRTQAHGARARGDAAAKRSRRATRPSAPASRRTSSWPPSRTSCARRCRPSWAGRMCWSAACSTPNTVRHGLLAISRNARTQVQLIEDLLDMNRIETGQLRLDLQRIELGGVIAAAIDSALPAATAKGIGLRTVFGATCRRGDGRRHSPAAGGGQPAEQRHQVHALGRAGQRHPDACTTAPGTDQRHRHRAGHRARVPGAPVRPLPAAGRQHHAPPRRPGHRPVDRAPSGRAARRHGAGATARASTAAPPSRSALPSVPDAGPAGRRRWARPTLPAAKRGWTA